MNKITVQTIDAFTSEPFTGNPAGVVLEADGLTDTQMQRIAREINCPETAFILPSTVAEADLRIRWFTPTVEVGLCGHATVAAFHALAEEGRYRLEPGTQQILYIETRSGVLPVSVDWRGETRWVWLGLPVPRFEPCPEVEELLRALGCPADACLDLPVVLTGERDVLLGVRELAQLWALKPDWTALERASAQSDLRGLCVFTPETIDPANHAHSRFFAPACGISEDPVTGSVSGPLAVWLCDRGLATGERLVLEQGDSMGRPGRVHVELRPDGPRIGGEAVTVLMGQMIL